MEHSRAAATVDLIATGGDRLYAELVSRNAIDLELVNRARAEVERRFRLASA